MTHMVENDTIVLTGDTPVVVATDLICGNHTEYVNIVDMKAIDEMMYKHLNHGEIGLNHVVALQMHGKDHGADNGKIGLYLVGLIGLNAGEMRRE